MKKLFLLKSDQKLQIEGHCRIYNLKTSDRISLYQWFISKAFSIKFRCPSTMTITHFISSAIFGNISEIYYYISWR